MLNGPEDQDIPFRVAGYALVEIAGEPVNG